MTSGLRCPGLDLNVPAQTWRLGNPQAPSVTFLPPRWPCPTPPAKAAPARHGATWDLRPGSGTVPSYVLVWDFSAIFSDVFVQGGWLRVSKTQVVTQSKVLTPDVTWERFHSLSLSPKNSVFRLGESARSRVTRGVCHPGRVLAWRRAEADPRGGRVVLAPGGNSYLDSHKGSWTVLSMSSYQSFDIK